MCTTVFTKDKTIYSVKELKNIGVEFVHEDYQDEILGEVDDDSCLCCFDLETILTRNNIKWEEVPDGYNIDV